MKKLKSTKIKNPILYSGIRESDIEYDQDYFTDNLCLFGNTIDKSFKKYRANQNYNKSDFTDFYASNFNIINEKYNGSNYRIMLYNQNNVFELSPKIKRTCYLL